MNFNKLIGIRATRNPFKTRLRKPLKTDIIRIEILHPIGPLSGQPNTDLGSDSDAALALEGDGVHGALMGNVGAALAEQAVHQGGLSMVDVRDHRHVTEPVRIEGAAGGRGSGRGGGGRGGEGA